MDAELQMIVDSLGQRICRPVAIDDVRLHLLAYSPHDRARLDRMRMASILSHVVPPDCLSWVLAQGITKATGPVRIPANSELGSDARVCVPIRANGMLLAFLWLTEDPEPLDDESLLVAVQAADAAAAVLYRHQSRTAGRREREAALADQLLAAEPETRANASRSLVDEGFLRDEGPVAVCVVRMRHLPGDTGPELQDATISEGLDQFQRSMAPHNCLVIARGDHGVAIVVDHEPALVILGLESLTRKLVGFFKATADDDAGLWVGGCSARPDTPSATWRAYREALDAAFIAERIPGYGPVASWFDLGPYRYLAALAADGEPELPESITRLLGLPPEGGLAETLERYLDLAGDVKSTAEALSLHRASLYYRLEKIESITERDLKLGDDRMELQMGLKMARLLNRYPPAAADEVPQQVEHKPERSRA